VGPPLSTRPKRKVRRIASVVTFRLTSTLPLYSDSSVLRRTCDEFSELSAERNIGSAQDDAFTAAVIEGIKFAAQNVSETEN
jgi:hypothetical protein